MNLITWGNFVNEVKATRSSFLANLNIFIPLFIFWAVVVGPYIALAFAGLTPMLFQRIGVVVSHPDVVGYALTVLSIICILAYRWYKEGLSPNNRKSNEGSYRQGHILVAIGNVLVLVSFAVPFLIAIVTGKLEMTELEWYALPVIAVGVVLWFIGVQKVKRSRA